MVGYSVVKPLFCDRSELASVGDLVNGFNKFDHRFFPTLNGSAETCSFNDQILAAHNVSFEAALHCHVYCIPYSQTKTSKNIFNVSSHCVH